MMDEAEKAKWQRTRDAWKGAERQARLRFKEADLTDRRCMALDWFELAVILRTEAKRALVWNFYNRYYERWHRRLLGSIFTPDAPVGDCSR